jgi:AcrR family transcriptional regulator
MSTRIERTHAAVMEAATALLSEGGPSAVTIDGVVARSGVAKSTVYRHWATRDELVADVFDHIAPKLEAPAASLDFESAVHGLVRTTMGMMNEPEWQKVLPALLMLKQHQKGIADVEERLQHTQLAVCTDVLQRGINEGRIAPDADIELLLTLLLGPLVMAGLTASTEMNEAFADQLVSHFLAGLSPVKRP